MRPTGSSGWRHRSAHSARVLSRSDPTSSCVRRRGSDQCPRAGAGGAKGNRRQHARRHRRKARSGPNFVAPQTLSGIRKARDSPASNNDWPLRERKKAAGTNCPWKWIACRPVTSPGTEAPIPGELPNLHTVEENKANRLKTAIEKPVFGPEQLSRSCKS